MAVVGAGVELDDAVTETLGAALTAAWAVLVLILFVTTVCFAWLLVGALFCCPGGNLIAVNSTAGCWLDDVVLLDCCVAVCAPLTTGDCLAFSCLVAAISCCCCCCCCFISGVLGAIATCFFAGDLPLAVVRLPYELVEGVFLRFGAT